MAEVLLVLLAGSACGSRLTHERLLADARLSATGASAEQAAAPEGSEAVGATSGGPAPGTLPVAEGQTLGGIPDTAALGPGAPTGTGGTASASAPKKAGDAKTTQPTAGGTGAPPPKAGGAAVVASSSPGGTGSPAAPAGEGCSASKNPIVIGQVGANSGILGGLHLPSLRAVQAWVATVNARGGIACHPVKYITADDGGDPSRRQALVQKLVETDRVIAMVLMTDGLSGSAEAAKYFEDKRVPVVSDSGGATWAYGNRMYFPIGPEGLSLAEAGVGAISKVVLPAGKPKIGTVYCIEVTVCSSSYDFAERQARKFGLDLVYRTKVSLAQPDYTSVCQAAQSAGAQSLAVYLDGNGVQRLAKSCARVNFKPTFGVVMLSLTDAFRTDPNLDGVTVSSSTHPWFDTSNAAVAEFHAALKRYAPSLEPNGPALFGWASAKLFELVAQKVSESPSREQILEGLWGVNSNNLGGLTMPLSFTKDMPPPNRYCFWTVQIKNGEVTTAPGTEQHCETGGQ